VVDQLELAARLAELLGGEPDQRFARGRGRLPDLHAAAHDAGAARGRSLVGRERGVALDHRDALDAASQLLGRHLRDRDAQALAEVHLAAVDRDAAVGVHREVAVDLVRVERLADRLVRARAASAPTRRPGTRSRRRARRRP
jgi:hypothetical protein